jgi:hypothetical protein
MLRPTQVKRLHAKFEHRRKSRHDVQASLFDFREIDDESRRELALRADEPSNVRQKFLVRASPEIHAGRLARGISSSPGRRTRAISESIRSRVDLSAESSRKGELRAATDRRRVERSSRARHTRKSSNEIGVASFFRGTVGFALRNESLALATPAKVHLPRAMGKAGVVCEVATDKSVSARCFDVDGEDYIYRRLSREGALALGWSNGSRRGRRARAIAGDAAIRFRGS